jgi:hypothetical protein
VKKKLAKMSSGELKTVEKRVQELGMKLAGLKGDQDTLSDSVKVSVAFSCPIALAQKRCCFNLKSR